MTKTPFGRNRRQRPMIFCCFNSAMGSSLISISISSRVQPFSEAFGDADAATIDTRDLSVEGEEAARVGLEFCRAVVEVGSSVGRL